MIGLLLITHGKLAKDFIEAAETIAGLVEAVECISIDDITDSEKLRKIIEKKISFLDQGEGVLVLTDMFGGTPSNVRRLSSPTGMIARGFLSVAKIIFS